MAEGEELETNILHVLLRNLACLCVLEGEELEHSLDGNSKDFAAFPSIHLSGVERISQSDAHHDR